MEINPKFNLGQEVWFMENNKAVSGIITAMYYAIGKVMTRSGSIDQFIDGYFKYFVTNIEEIKYENALFASKEELIANFILTSK